MRVRDVESTPNPHAIKLVLREPHTTGIRSYHGSNTPSDDALGEQLLAIEGVVGVLIHESFITLSRAPSAKWGPIQTAAEAVLAQHA